MYIYMLKFAVVSMFTLRSDRFACVAVILYVSTCVPYIYYHGGATEGRWLYVRW